MIVICVKILQKYFASNHEIKTDIYIQKSISLKNNDDKKIWFYNQIK